MSEFEKAVTGLGEECGVFGAYDVLSLIHI